MSEHRDDDAPALDLSEVASESPETSVAEEHDVVGDTPGGDANEGDTVPEGDSQ